MKINLTEENLLGKGTNKIVYYHPEDKNKCIKVSIDSQDETDIQYELRFRKICKDRVERSALLAKYYGTIETDKGLGYVFEVIRDYDGKLSETFEELLLREGESPKALEILRMFKRQLLEEAMVTYTIFPDNFLIQRVSESEIRIRIIDGIGMHVLFPLPYYSKFLARIHQKKIFARFMKRLREHYGFDTDKI